MINDSKLRLCMDWVGQSSLIGWDASQKHNGCFAYWDGVTTCAFYSRDGLPILAPDWFKEGLPRKILTGEIHAGTGTGIGNNNSAYKVAMTAVVHGGKWFDKTDDGNPVQFTVFDAPRAIGNWVERMAYAAADWHNCVEITRIESPRHLVEYMMRLRSIGAEGTMFNDPSEVRYVVGRRPTLLRWKFEK